MPKGRSLFMGFKEQIRKFYLEHTPGATVAENLLKASCPFCSSGETEKPAKMVVCLNPESYFFGYFNCRLCDGIPTMEFQRGVDLKKYMFTAKTQRTLRYIFFLLYISSLRSQRLCGEFFIITQSTTKIQFHALNWLYNQRIYPP